MKKIILLMFVALTTVFSVNAQYILTYEGETLGDTITIYPESSTSATIEFAPLFVNNSSDTAYVKVVREEIELTLNSESTFCWGACFPPETDSSGTLYILSGETSDQFSAHFVVGEYGISVISYKFYNVLNPDVYVKIVVKFDTRPSGINENILNNSWVSELYPNPSSDMVTIDYSFPSDVESVMVKVVNLVGSVVMEKTLDASANSQSINVSELNSGLYFYSLFVNDENFSTKKLIVK